MTRESIENNIIYLYLTAIIILRYVKNMIPTCPPQGEGIFESGRGPGHFRGQLKSIFNF